MTLQLIEQCINLKKKKQEKKGTCKSDSRIT